mmetsp:Transcript_1039/g.2341  ORF Transcript_1039/g.2341 Transcript_1039/m.2341 type:complete len:200 (+) Transcript_1039:243-842(+)
MSVAHRQLCCRGTARISSVAFSFTTAALVGLPHKASGNVRHRLAKVSPPPFNHAGKLCGSIMQTLCMSAAARKLLLSSTMIASFRFPCCAQCCIQGGQLLSVKLLQLHLLEHSINSCSWSSRGEGGVRGKHDTTSLELHVQLVDVRADNPKSLRSPLLHCCLRLQPSNGFRRLNQITSHCHSLVFSMFASFVTLIQLQS